MRSISRILSCRAARPGICVLSETMAVRLSGVVAWLVLGVCLYAGPARTQETTRPRPVPATPPPASAGDPDRGDMVTLNFDGVDLVEVIHVLAQHLRLNYTIDPEVQGVVTLFSGQPVRRDDVLPIFHEILRIHGAVAVRHGTLYRITAISKGPGAGPSGRHEGGRPGHAGPAGTLLSRRRHEAAAGALHDRGRDDPRSCTRQLSGGCRSAVEYPTFVGDQGLDRRRGVCRHPDGAVPAQSSRGRRSRTGDVGGDGFLAGAGGARGHLRRPFPSPAADQPAPRRGVQ